MKDIAIVTGASSGLGREFAKTITKNIKIDEMWVISRKKEELEKLVNEIDVPLKILPMDLTSDNNILKLEEELKKENPNIKLLVNASGYGKFEKTTKISKEDSLGMIKLNVEALTSVSLTCLPYMKKESHLINFASVAAFQPVPYVNVYASTKAYVLSFTRSLNAELKKDGIHAMAVCPFWTKTNFFNRAVSDNVVVKKYVCMYEISDNINKAWKDLKKGKDVSQYGFVARVQSLLSKILPHKLIMKIWMKQQSLD